MRLAILGGTFDPIHIGHLVAAEEVRWTLRLERVLFVPAGTPPHKGGQRITPTVHRVRMVELAIADNPRFGLSLVDVRRPGKSYTVETLEILHSELGPGVELHFIVGMDSLEELMTWREPERLITLCRLAVVNRPPHGPASLAHLERHLPGISRRVDLVEMPAIGVAASDLRRRVAGGLPIRYQVPRAVEEYIRETGLYADPPRVP